MLHWYLQVVVMIKNPGFRGFSIIQGIAVSAVGVMLFVYLWLSFSGIQETRDAELVDTVQVTLQATVSHGITTLQLPPDQISPANIINAARTSLPKGIYIDRTYKLHINHSGREAQFKITPEGDLLITALKNFTRYHVKEGRIARNNRWVIPVDFDNGRLTFHKDGSE